MKNMFRRYAILTAALAGLFAGALTNSDFRAWAQGFVLPPSTQAGGKILAGGVVPTVSTCGTSPTIVGSDFAGTVTTGSTNPGNGPCTITFGNAFTSTPFVLLNSHASAVQPTYTVSPTAITITIGGSSQEYSYVVIGRTGG